MKSPFINQSGHRLETWFAFYVLIIALAFEYVKNKLRMKFKIISYEKDIDINPGGAKIKIANGT